MKVEDFIKILGVDYFTGVPDSQLKPLCNYLMKNYGISSKHIIAANEGNAVALAAGYHLATGKVPMVYMQNSGLGNIVNPVTSLLNDKVYGIPCIFVIGWRGEPGVKDEPQHIFQGEITLDLLELLDIKAYVLREETTKEELIEKIDEFNEYFKQGKSIAFVVAKNALTFEEKYKYKNNYELNREEIIEQIAITAKDDIIVSTTGKASRELFEIRERNHQGHGYDFLTVGSMGHASSIAQSIAMQQYKRKVWCIDGDGAALMHLGAMALAGGNEVNNLVHVVINNGAHETVGGMPVPIEKINWKELAQALGYKKVYSVDTKEELEQVLSVVKKENKLTFIEIKASLGSREDLGRPTTTAKENKLQFMKYLKREGKSE